MKAHLLVGIILVQIRDVYNWLLIESDCPTLKEVVQNAVMRGISLAYANLEDIDLQGAYLCYGDFYRATFSKSKTSGVSFFGSDLTQAIFK